MILSTYYHYIFHHSVKLHKQSLGACEEEGGVKAVGGAHGENLRLPEQVVAVAANVEEAAMGGRVVQTSTSHVQRLVNQNLRDHGSSDF